MISMDRNTSPKSPLTKNMINEAVEQANIETYPEEELEKFKTLYAKRNGFKTNQIEVANGSDEWIQKIVMTLGQNGVMSFKPDFFMYQVYTNQVGIRFYSVPSRNDFSFDFEAATKAIHDKKPSVFFISNPHNPTGVLLPSYAIQQLADAMRAVGGYLVIDEAYGEFALERKIPKGEHVIILRTLSKVYGLAGLRIGIVIAEGKTYDAITKINHPYPLNSISLVLANALLSDETKLDDWFTYQKNLHKQLVDSFEIVRRHVRIKPSHTNFVFIYGDQARALYEYLYENGFKGRVYEDDDQLKNVARFSIIDEVNITQLRRLITKWGEDND